MGFFAALDYSQYVQSDLRFVLDQISVIKAGLYKVILGQLLATVAIRVLVNSAIIISPKHTLVEPSLCVPMQQILFE